MALKLTAGDLTIHRLIEQETTFLPALELLPGLTPEVLAENKAWMQKAGALDADDVLILCFQSYVVKTPHHTILIDSCIGNDKPRPLRPKWNMKTDDTYARALAAAGFSVGDIDYVMCTHLHVDHVGWNTRLDNGRWVPTFPNARYVFSRVEREFFDTPAGESRRMVFDDSVLPVIDAGLADEVGPEGGDYLPGIRFHPTPGHSAGHMSIEIESAGAHALFSGDVWHHPIQVYRPAWSSVFCADKHRATVSRRWVLGRAVETGATVFTPHFAGTSAGVVDVVDVSAQSNGGFAWRFV